MEKRYYIAYGSNLNVQSDADALPSCNHLRHGRGWTDWELLFKGSKTGSYLTVEKCEGGTVPAVVWEVTEQDEKALDRYEGYPEFLLQDGS